MVEILVAVVGNQRYGIDIRRYVTYILIFKRLKNIHIFVGAQKHQWIEVDNLAILFKAIMAVGSGCALQFGGVGSALHRECLPLRKSNYIIVGKRQQSLDESEQSRLKSERDTTIDVIAERGAVPAILVSYLHDARIVLPAEEDVALAVAHMFDKRCHKRQLRQVLPGSDT